MKSSMISAHVCVELPVMECVQFRGVPTPDTRTTTFFTLGVCGGAATSFVSSRVPPNLSAIFPSQRGKSIARRGKKAALIRSVSRPAEE